MRIAYLTTDFGVPPLGTKGASVHVRRLVAALEAEGHEIVLLAPQAGRGAGESVRARLVEIPPAGPAAAVLEALRDETVCRDNRLAKDLRNVLYTAWLPDRAEEALRGFAPQVVYERYCLFGTAGLTLARRLGVPLMLEVNAPLVEEQESQRGLSLPLAARAAQRLVFREADRLIVVSRWLRDYVVAEGAAPDRVTIMPNGADADLFSPRSGERRRRDLGWEDRFVAGFVGSMKSWHGLTTVLEAMALLGVPRSRFRLLLVGDGPELPALRRQAEALGLADGVRATGAVPYPEVPEWMATMDAALAPYAPSAEEYFSPVKLFEYMAMERPVVAAAVEQTLQVIEEGTTGWLYAPGDAAALASRLEWLAVHPREAAAAGEAARLAVMARHTWRHNARQVAQLAQLLIARSP